MAKWTITAYGPEVRYKSPLKIVDHETNEVLHEGTVRQVDAMHEHDVEYAHSGWIWTCSCGGKGRPQFQSADVSAFGFWYHVHKKCNIQIPRSRDSKFHLGWEWYRREKNNA